jgi:hypothetical protein
MLRSLAQKYLDNVYRSPEDEGGADDGSLEHISGASADDGGVGDNSDGSGEASGEGGQQRLSVRDEIKKAMSEANQAAQPKPKIKKAAEPKQAAQQAQQANQTQQAQQTQQTQTIEAPDRLGKEAKADWDKAPESIKQAFVKAEQDMQRGVDELKQRYAGIDQALAPHTDALRQMNATPAEAVNRMFLWFKALAGSPTQAFPGLAKSMGLDWGKIVASVQPGQQQQGQQQQQQPEQQGTPPVIPDEIRSYVSGLETNVRNLAQQLNAMQTGFGSIQHDLQAEQMRKTEENLNLWSKDKEFFQDVRQDMARLIQADPELIKNGQVDLDGAYERAIYYNPVVRAKVLAKQQQANQQVQQEATQQATTARQTQVAKAKKAAVSLPVGNAPSNLNGAAQPKKPQGKTSVRDSIKAAMAELRDQ